MADVNTTSIDIAPLTVIVSEALDPRVRRQLEADQQADVMTYQELTRSMEAQESLNKIKQEVEDKDDDVDPFKKPEPVEDSVGDAGQTPAPASTPVPTEGAAPPPATPGTEQPVQTETTNAPAGGAEATGGDAEDLSSAFEGYGHKLPANLIGKVCREYLALEAADIDGAGELEHIKQFVYVDLNQNAVTGDTLNSVQSLRDPDNTIVVINEDGADAETLLRARSVSSQLSSRGARVLGNLEEATNYLNDLYDVIVGRKKD